MISSSACICPTCARQMTRELGVKVAFYAKAIGPERPYEVYHADLFTCRYCHRDIVTGFATAPVWHHFYADPVPECQVSVYEYGMTVPPANDYTKFQERDAARGG